MAKKKVGYFLDRDKRVDDVTDIMPYPKGMDWHHFTDTASFFEAVTKQVPDVVSMGHVFEQQVTLEDEETMSAYAVLVKLLNEKIPVKDLDNGKVMFYFHSHMSSVNNILKSYLKGFRDLIVKERAKK